MSMSRLGLSLGLIGICALFRQTLEADPVKHVLLQLPFLATSGYLFAIGLGVRNLRINKSIANAFSLISVFVILFWMLPRYIDASLVNPMVEFAKFVSIPLFVGGSLAIGWEKSNPFLCGFLKANSLSMLGVLAFLYTYAPVRICNSYLVIDQERLGAAFLITAIGLALAWAIPLFSPPPQETSFMKISNKKAVI